MTLDVTRVVSWVCPACGATDQTREANPHTRFHICPRMRYLTTPMVESGVKARIVLREREDYVKDEKVQLDPERGRPVMSIITEYPDGRNDTAVFAPTATASGRTGL